ncbi:hypothetical protein THASP1DRAFT_23390 [Thamnocephalis sphaerospora]|uniref:Cyclin N-terminal domain-containing protein n=1 Tax=Thamnocephalis sphaerospora TaxID=78915 RepID=A0A4P9XRG1_9FUNG|nr:hypothetical protein THASP1DRAFT_23390 [Thamnocephalis sphaerospora]|eukprot:RKP08665.1 hypothetical protein THASP1DRAFT_23390 [Thamnocephalis sphaerospora]
MSHESTMNATSTKQQKAHPLQKAHLPQKVPLPDTSASERLAHQTTSTHLPADCCTVEEANLLRRALIAQHLFEMPLDSSVTMAPINMLPKLVPYIERLVTATHLPLHTICVALLYLLRLKERYPDVHGAHGTAHRIALTALIVANKYVDDDSYGLRSWHRVTRRWFAHDDVIVMESEFLQRLGFRLEVSRDTWREFVLEVELRMDAWRDREQVACARWPSLSQAVGLWEATEREWLTRDTVDASTPRVVVDAAQLAMATKLSSMSAAVTSPLPTELLEATVSSAAPSVAPGSSAASTWTTLSFGSFADNSPALTDDSLSTAVAASRPPVLQGDVWPAHPGGVHHFKQTQELRRHQSAPVSLRLPRPVTSNGAAAALPLRLPLHAPLLLPDHPTTAHKPTPLPHIAALSTLPIQRLTPANGLCQTHTDAAKGSTLPPISVVTHAARQCLHPATIHDNGCTVFDLAAGCDDRSAVPASTPMAPTTGKAAAGVFPAAPQPSGALTTVSANSQPATTACPVSAEQSLHWLSRSLTGDISQPQQPQSPCQQPTRLVDPVATAGHSGTMLPVHLHFP